MEPMKSIPVYRHSAAYAVEHGELEAYKTSRVAGVACRDAIEKAVAKHYRDNCLNKAGAREVIDEFGKERVMTVLAITLMKEAVRMAELRQKQLQRPIQVQHK